MLSLQLRAKAELERRRRIPTEPPLWQPNPDHSDGSPNPQRLALESQADELFYGGQAGGGKTDLLIGCPLVYHTKSVIFRRINPNLQEIEDRLIEIIGSDDNYNRSKKILRHNGKRLELETCQHEHDKKKQQGRPRDFYGFDEITEFTHTQYQFIIGWNRTTVKGQRCRVIVTGNPPTDEAGSWVIEAWAPWLDDKFHDPAEPGELRWYYYQGDSIVWLKSGEPVEDEGLTIIPRSRTFIPAGLSDNPHLSSDDQYLSVLLSMPEPLRSSLLKGDFTMGLESDPWQVIPTEWVKMAQRRWLEQDKPDIPLTAVGIDPARGGRDKMSIAKRYGHWFEVIGIPGVEIIDGPVAAERVRQEVEGEPEQLTIDVIGIGSSPYDTLKDMYENVYALNVGERSDYTDKSGKLRMRNKRAEMYWRMREALDPYTGDDLALPQNNEIVADLCAARYTPTASGIQIESKEDIKKRIGRSPDVGEAIMMSMFPPEPIPVAASEIVEVDTDIYKPKRRSRLWQR